MTQALRLYHLGLTLGKSRLWLLLHAGSSAGSSNRRSPLLAPAAESIFGPCGWWCTRVAASTASLDWCMNEYSTNPRGRLPPPGSTPHLSSSPSATAVDYHAENDQDGILRRLSFFLALARIVVAMHTDECRIQVVPNGPHQTRRRLQKSPDRLQTTLLLAPRGPVISVMSVILVAALHPTRARLVFV